MLNYNFLILSTITLIVLSGRQVKGYESVHNQSLGKMEMLEAIDKYIKNSISKDIAFLKSEVQKLKRIKEKGSKKRYSSTNSYQKQNLDRSSENSSEIRRIRGDLDRLIRRVNSLSSSLERISKNFEN